MPTLAGQRITDINELKTLKESDIARVGSDIYRRDLAKEQAAMKTYSAPRRTAEENMAFNKSVYASIPKPENIMTDQTTGTVGDTQNKPELPQQASDAIQNAFIESSTANVDKQKENLFNVYKTQNEEYQKQIEELNKQVEEERVKQEELIKKTAPENLPYAEQVSSITQDRLNAAKSASSTLQANFENNQNSIKELESILAQVNSDIKAAESRPGLRAAKAYDIAQVRADGAGRVGVIQAVMSARDGQINMAQNMIDNAFQSVTVAKNDALNYYQNLMNFYDETKKDKETKIASLDKDAKQVIENQISLLKSELNEAQAVKDTVSKLIFTDPNMVEQAGIKLTDTMSQIQIKLANWQNTYAGVEDLMKSYPDAGIKLTDTIDQANSKLKLSRIYQEKVRTPESVGGGMAGGAGIDESKVISIGGKSYDFSNYATDPNWGVAVNNILSSLPVFSSNQEVNNYIQSQAPGSILKAEDIESVANETGVSPELLLAVAAHESAFGTSLVAKNNNNLVGYSNVGTPGTARPEGGYYTKFNTPKDSLMALANNIKNRETAPMQGAFGAFINEQIALSALPVQTRNSDTELKRALAGIRAGLAEGKSPYEIADNLMGYKINNPNDFSNALRGYISQSEKLTGSDPAEFARMINSGNYTGAVNKLETSLLKGTDGKNQEAIATYSSDYGSKAKDLISSSLDKMGIVAGNWKSLKKKFVKSEDFQKLSSSLSGLISAWRHDMIGSAATENELKMIEELIPKVSDNPFNAMQKIDELKYMTLTSANSTREAYGLPALDDNSLIDKNQRVNLYAGNNQTNEVITVISPDGVEGTIPANQLEEALKEGYKQK